MNQDIQNKREKGEGHDHILTFYVNGELCETSIHKLTVREILNMSGFTPEENYRLNRDNGGKLFTDMSLEIPIHKDEHFTATYNGATPVSYGGDSDDK